MRNKLSDGMLQGFRSLRSWRPAPLAPRNHPAPHPPSTPPSGMLRYMVQLDGLRAFAVIAVMMHHFLPHSTLLRSTVPWGSLGVRLFFVLSGFLITGILLRCRDLIYLGKQDARQVIRNFYARRFLRILPIYYLTLLVGVILNIQPIRETLLWHLAYASNLYIAISGHWLGTLSHLWSLSMEEQFYLVWPWLILLLPQRYLLPLIGLTIGIAPLFRGLAIGTVLDETQGYVFPLSSLDALGLGALLAFYQNSPDRFGTAKRWLCQVGLWVCLPAYLLLKLLPVNEDAGWGVALQPLFMSMVFVWLVSRTAQGFSGLPGQVLSCKPLVYVGKISYGLYLYHAVIQGILPALFNRLHLPYPDSVLLRFCLLTATSLLVATVSWYWIEVPINRLKHHFSYRQNPV